MAYTTGSLSGGPDSLLVALSSFLSSCGWTINDNCSTDNSTYDTWTGLDGSGKRLHVQKTASDGTVMYFNIRSTVRGMPFEWRYDSSAFKTNGLYYSEITGLAINGSTGYNASNSWDKQPGYTVTDGGESTGASISYLSTTTIPNYWFFENGDTVNVVVEYESGKMMHLLFGNCEKEGTWTGGQFFAATLKGKEPAYCYDHTYAGGSTITKPFLSSTQSNQSGVSHFMYVENIESYTGWRGNSDTNFGTYGNQLKTSVPVYGDDLEDSNRNAATGALCAIFANSSPNDLTGVLPLIPIYQFIYRGTYSKWSLAGTIEGMRMCMVQNKNPADEITIGTDVWKIFPHHYKSDQADGGCDGVLNQYIGYAIKKTT